jgi:uncharacterized protein
MVRAVSVLALLLLVSCNSKAAEPPPIVRSDLPLLTGRVVDNADLLRSAKEAELTGKLKALEDRTTHQFVVVTLPSLNGRRIEDVGLKLGRTWRVGQKSKNNGVILLVAPNERMVRIEVGYGLEKVLTDPLCAQFIREDIVPRFSHGDMAGGIEAGVDDVVAVLDPVSNLRKAA